jgi:hypothetical protein
MADMLWAPGANQDESRRQSCDSAANRFALIANQAEPDE